MPFATDTFPDVVIVSFDRHRSKFGRFGEANSSHFKTRVNCVDTMEEGKQQVM